MADYFNAKTLLPPDLLFKVLEHIPEASRNAAILYFHEDFYARRNAEIIAAFRIYQADPHFGNNVEIYEALAEQYGLTLRHVCRILKGEPEGTEKRRRRGRRVSGIRVTKSTRRMLVRPQGAPD